MQTTRRYDIDWLRVLAFCLLILFHTGMFFNYWGWHVKNNVQTRIVQYPMIFTSQWRMALLFMISGMGVYWALQRRTPGQFLGERAKRILLPLVFGMLVIVPPQIYFERLTQGEVLSYAQFYPRVLDFRPYPKGDFSWHHLWYLAYLFVYCVAGLPFFLFLRTKTGERLTRWIGQLAANPLALIALPVAWHWLAEYWWDGKYPTTNDFIHDWRQHWHYFSLFLTGYVFCTQAVFWETLVRYRHMLLTVVIVLTTVLYAFFWIDRPQLSDTARYGFLALTTTNSWCVLLTLFAFAYRYLRFSNRFLVYANEAVYPFYILHQTITVSAGYYLAPLAMPWFLKFWLLAGITFGGCFVLYHFVIRRFAVTRVLFGLKAGRPAVSLRLT